jgi:cell pole-organizing protein PopZ
MTAIPESTAAEQRAHESSMEEILASIRKIISDDVALPLSPRVAAPDTRPAPVAPSRPTGDFSLSPPPAAPRIPRIEPRPEPAYAPPVARQPEPLRPLAPIARPIETAPVSAHLTADYAGEDLISNETGQAVAASFKALSAARPAMPDAQAMEAMARELLRPMLKDWLDDNLPTIVERLVRAEIERVARGPR